MTPTRPAFATAWPALLIAVLALLPLVKCWDAPFLSYDDNWHIYENNLVMSDNITLWDLVKTPQEPMYFPLTQISYRLDRHLFDGWMTHALGSWAPGVRLMNWLYHAGAAIILWRVMLALGLPPLGALFAAAVFAVHPTVCETICWPSERKTTLAGLFSMACLWAYFRDDKRIWRMPLVLFFYTCALFSKPSALGLLPIFLFFDLLGARRGVIEKAPLDFRLREALLPAIERFIPLALLAAACLALNFAGKGRGSLMPPPGGTLFTAVLTDFAILSRYIYAIFLPVGLSSVYYVEPITTVFCERFMLCAAFLGGLFAVSLWLSANRRRTLFGWLWFLSALGPNLNLISMPHLMQDRYLYLAMPGVLVVAVDILEGVYARLRATADTRTMLRLAAAVYVVALAFGSVVRGSIFTNIYDLFKDATEKQPLAAHARYAFAGACAQVIQVMVDHGLRDPADYEQKRALYGKACMDFIDLCPDNARQTNYTEMALRAGDYCIEEGDLPNAERYFRISAEGLPHLTVLPETRSAALCRLATMARNRQQFEQARAFAAQAVQSDPLNGEARLLDARLLEKFANFAQSADAARTYLDEARADLLAVPADSPAFGEARQMLKELEKP